MGISRERLKRLKKVTSPEAFKIVRHELELRCENPEAGARLLYVLLTFPRKVIPGLLVMSRRFAVIFESHCQLFDEGQLTLTSIGNFLCEWMHINPKFFWEVWEEECKEDSDYDEFLTLRHIFDQYYHLEEGLTRERSRRSGHETTESFDTTDTDG